MRRRDNRSMSTSTDPVIREGLSLDAKIRISHVVTDEALTRFQAPVIMWTGGKDSMLVLSFFREAAERLSVSCPPVLFIDHGMHFDETWHFLDKVSQEWNLQKIVAKNDDVLSHAQESGSSIRIGVLSEVNKSEARRAGQRKGAFPYDLGSLVANHLLKTVPMNEAIRDRRFDAVATGIRWDESEFRSRERFISPRADPPHARIHPILHFSEREVWMETLRGGLPVHPLYEKGFRSIDGKDDSKPVDDVPAWEQDLEGTVERAGRAQDKELVMKRLRDLGYM